MLPEVVRRSGIDPSAFDDIIFAESHYGGGDLARYAAAATGMEDIPGQSVNRHCAGSLTAIGNAAAQIGSGMERALIAGGVQSLSMTPLMNRRIPGPRAEVRGAVDAADASGDPGCALQGHVDHRRVEHRAEGRHHPRGNGRVGGPVASARVAAIDDGKFLDEIIPMKVQQFDGSVVDFSVDEYPAPRHHRRKAGRAEGPASGDRRVLDHRGQQQRHQRRRGGGGPRGAATTPMAENLSVMAP